MSERSGHPGRRCIQSSASLLAVALFAWHARGDDSSPAPASDPASPDVAPAAPNVAQSVADPRPAPELGATKEGSPSAVEVTVRGSGIAKRMRQSSEAVTVVETERAKREAADLAEVLARTDGVSVRRDGGLGSGTRLSLNGLTGEQVRFFLDGVPLEFSGFGLGIGNIPVNLVERVEIYRGVVPVRFGADALGGAINLVTRQDLRGTHGAASYEIGAYRTHRATVSAQHADEATGLLVRAAAFGDYAKNDYPVDVEVPDAVGRPTSATVRRFHDAYRAYGANAEIGVTKRPWADRLILRAYATTYDKELQNNIVMTVPYGEARYGENAYGASLRYDQSIATGLRFNGVAGYARRTVDFVDMSPWIYDWFGRRIAPRAEPGEIARNPTDRTVWQDAVYARSGLAYTTEHHALRLAVAPTYTTRDGEERTTRADVRDPLSAPRSLFTNVIGLEYRIDVLEGALENTMFVKDYWYAARADEYLPRNITQQRDADRHRLGFGDSLRLRFTPWLYAKGSYEYATRLPAPDEVFGDGVRVAANLDIVPEVSHNTNLGLACELARGAYGAFRAEATGFDRRASELIALLGNGEFFIFDNVQSARSTGFEFAAAWDVPGDLLALTGNVTWQDFRNVSKDGPFAEYDGDRVPNRPYFFANGSARFALRDISSPSDELAFTWTTRYVHAFLRGWESVGQTDYKQEIPAQWLQSVALTYLVRGGGLAVSSTIDVQNLTDQKAYDFFGVQRPGRAVYFKGTLEY
ncbi:MAG: TonB-dependent siderophore myxochelin receptor MxcH [Polyangiaceae bacterium]